jgi:tRNA(Met) cytidine acetyltransferase
VDKDMTKKVFHISIRRDDIDKILSGKYKFFVRSIVAIGRDAVRKRYRILIVLSSSQPVAHGLAVAYLLMKYYNKFQDQFKKPRILYMYRKDFDEEIIRMAVTKRLLEKKSERIILLTDEFKRSEDHMGKTYQGLVMDLSDGIKPNDIGRLVGVVEGGGLIIILSPSLERWPESRNIFAESLVVPRYPKPRNVFIRWFIRSLENSSGVYIFDLDKGETIKFSEAKVEEYERKEIKLPENYVFSQQIYRLALTQDQINVIKAVEELIPKPSKKKMIVVTADRGRGKSGALGIAIPALIKELLKVKNKVRVGVTAISPANIDTLMSLAKKSLEILEMKYKVIERRGRIIELKGSNFSIEYWEPAIIPRLDLDVVVVDEAAGLPVTILNKIWKNFNRIIMASTIHGYEGAGRGFSIRFLKRVKNDPNTDLIYLTMEEPIRYSRDDPVEKWVFKTLLLDAEPEELTDEDYQMIRNREFIYLTFEPEELFKEENIDKLKSIFGIYVEAHYRNEPDDLAMIADAPHHKIRALALNNGKIVASAQIAEEGGLPEDLIKMILEEKSVHGNIIPDRVIKYYRDPVFGKWIGYRIVRIAVHPQAQGMGIGSFFIQKIIEEATSKGLDWAGSGFGASEELLRYWIKNGFVPIHISPSRNPVSGEYSVIVLKGLKEESVKLIRYFREKFRERFLLSLYDTYRDIEPEIAILLLKPDHLDECSNEKTGVKIELDEIDRDRIRLYIKRLMTYEVVNDLIYKIVMSYWKDPCIRNRLKKEYEMLMVSKVLQGKSWEASSSEINVSTGRATEYMRNIITMILELIK